MTTSRNPHLDQLLRNPELAVSLTADDAHKAAAELFEANAPLRTARNPHLSRLLKLARSEFDNPDYVDAILRNMARLDPREIYNPYALDDLVSGLPNNALDASSMASLAQGLLGARDKARRREKRARDTARARENGRPLSKVDDLFCLFVEPFDDVAARAERTSSRSSDAGHSGLSSSVPAPVRARASTNYRSIAKLLHMPQRDAIYLLLRFCYLPTKHYAAGMGRLCSFSLEPEEGERDRHLLGTYLHYTGGKRATDVGLRVDRLCSEILQPLAEVGGFEPSASCEPVADLVTTF